ncbi:hypothetical protein EV144_10931 [Flavobacterium sp. 270]|uniref:hypothetical protein n=1 Tax=Flavobacterium sp. 270 TaxID=2512114 RepID=UPI0010660A7A|nr:hypothetical protein [Flavobacterium sp. 270]TDW44282.1 hypothetical protein EV144_10931 [Flavobacterium sp. 270]
MRNIILIAFVILSVYSCQKKDPAVKKNIIKAIIEDTLTKTAAGTADVSDAPAKDDKVVNMIRKQLLILLQKDVPAMTKEDRFFYYDAVDLNNDKKDEYVVGFTNSYFCGSGGCSGYILNNDGSVISNFTVTEFPILIAPSSSEKFQDLLFSSKGKFHLMKMKNGKYPPNPSVQEIWKEKIPEKAFKILDIYKEKYEKFSF